MIPVGPAHTNMRDLCMRVQTLRSILIPLFLLSAFPFEHVSAAPLQWLMQNDGRSILITHDSGKVRLTAYGDAMVRVQTVRNGEDFFSDDRSEMVESHQWPGSFTCRVDSVLHIASGGEHGLRMQWDGRTRSLSFYHSDGTTPFLSESRPVSWIGDTIRVSFRPDTDEHFTGLGHGYFGRESSIDLKGKVIQRNYGSEHGQQAPLLVPFFLSSNGYGFFLNSTFPNRFSFGAGGSYDCAITGDGRMDYFIINGPGFRDILDRYTQLTGRPRMFPKAALGLALSDKGNDHTTNDPSDERWWKRKISEHRAAGFPIDHIVNDNRWRAGGGQRCLSYFEWDRERFPDPAEYARWVRTNGLIMTIDFNRCIASHSEGWLPSFNIPNAEGIDFNDSAPDLTRPEVRKWWWQLFWSKSLDPKLSFPGDALWIDEFDEMGKASGDLFLGNGRTWREMRNYWFFLVAKALVQDGWDKSGIHDKRPFVWVRGMTAGGQRYATLWSGDIKPTYDDMRTQVRAMQLAGLSGFPFWGHDAGGFNDWESKRGPDDTMYRQWSLAFGSMSPFWKPHGMGASRWPLYRPAAVHADAHRYTELRYRLMPYTYTEFRRAFDSGIPVAHAMVLDHQTEPEAWTHDLQYQWGDAFLVAPNCSDSDRVQVWLPKGMWYDFWTDSMMAGDRIIERRSPVGVLPLYVKAGSIIPMANMGLSTALQARDSITVHIYTGEDGTYEWYEDDGTTEQYRSEHGSRRTPLSYDDRTGHFIIEPAVGSYEGAVVGRVITVVIHNASSSAEYRMNGRRLPLLKRRDRTVTIALGSHSVRERIVIERFKK